MIFNLFHKKRDTFSKDDIADRICRTLEFKLNIVRHSFITEGIPIVKKEMLFDYIEHVVEVYMRDSEYVYIHSIIHDTSEKQKFIISDVWTKVETTNCHDIGVYGICKAVKQCILRKTCRQFCTLISYLFMKNYVGITPHQLDEDEFEKYNMEEEVVYFAQLPPENILDWIISKNYSNEQLAELNRLYKEIKQGDKSND